MLARLGAYRDPFTGLLLVPSEKTFRQVLAGLDADALDAAISGYVADLVRREAPVPQIPDTPGPAEREQRGTEQRQCTHPAPPGLLPGAAVDGKACRGARTADGGRVFLVGAISHDHGVVLGQCQVASKRGEGLRRSRGSSPADHRHGLIEACEATATHIDETLARHA
ncbi:hypothetical protein [Nonomuraea sp. SYSU D8015]|uniref:hypothetical protein n=1 Tax=Nonomuraea sp. SYSU D8015 TaxID=2593644 RepID=UPI0016615341|nr:hypothetical protein [Nonomuraea sp. SYSU D8015]